MNVMIAIAIQEGHIKSKKHLADLMGVSQSVLSRWVNDKSILSVENLFLMAKILNCKVDDLYYFDDR